jgi:23S rRNA G2069 N7-methylase RlmK/C1962 C5-methylase RlmI
MMKFYMVKRKQGQWYITELVNDRRHGCLREIDSGYHVECDHELVARTMREAVQKRIDMENRTIADCRKMVAESEERKAELERWLVRKECPLLPTTSVPLP